MDPAKKESSDEFRREVGDALIANLKRLRNRAGLSQENLSLRAKLTRTHVNLIENGERFPKLDTVHRLAGALGVEAGELLKGFSWRPDESGDEGKVADESLEEGA